MKFTVKRHRFTKGLDLITGLQNASRPCTPHHNVTKDLFIVVLFTWFILNGYQEKITKHTKRQKTKFKETDPS